MEVHDAIGQAYKNGYEDGVKSVTDNNVGDKLTPTDKDTNVPSKWISVAERLPEESGEYLVYCGEYDGICVLYYEILKTKSKLRSKWKEVTHWMPLPEPPKGE